MLTTPQTAPGSGLEDLIRMACENSQLVLEAPALTAQDVHRIRVETKRLRALLALSQDEATAPGRRVAHQALRATARVLAASRDAYALHQLALSLRKKCEDRRERAALDILCEALSGRVCAQFEPGTSRDSMWASLQLAREQLLPWVRESNGATLLAALEASRQRCLEQLLRARAEPGAFALHALRRRLKAFLYQLDACLDEVWLQSKPRTRLQRLGSGLGESHDLWVLHSLVLPLFDAKLDPESYAALEHLLRRRERRLAKRALAKSQECLQELAALTCVEAELA